MDAEVKRILQNKEDHYKVLGVPRGSTKDQIRSSYRKIAVKIHPDRNSDPRATEAFIVLKRAYEELTTDQPKFSHTAHPGGTHYRHAGAHANTEFEELLRWYMSASQGNIYTFTAHHPFSSGFSRFGYRHPRERADLEQAEVSTRALVMLVVFLILFGLIRG
ncbi:DnaJ-like protein subfamily B member 12 [Nematocida major]|uniref:DnaJ-like protein subfamily B member 12 n=1 Tax=Nematocida major TaxID=1912982 RepID=UPI0020082BD1|nr:DnaJ-like protein subfamily B member 12 [Nematocida major]KAH9386625.1 DnaJ-like protein subfamily B member 12 [Nematocida major]